MDGGRLQNLSQLGVTAARAVPVRARGFPHPITEISDLITAALPAAAQEADKERQTRAQDSSSAPGDGMTEFANLSQGPKRPQRYVLPIPSPRSTTVPYS